MSSHDIGAEANGTASAKASSGSASDLPPPSERGENGPLATAYDLMLAIKQDADGLWYVGGEDPELIVCAAHDALLSGEAQITRLEGERDAKGWLADVLSEKLERRTLALEAAEAETARLSALLDQAIRRLVKTDDGEDYDFAQQARAFLTRLSKTGGEGEEGVSPSRTSPSSPDSRRPEALSDLEGER